MGRMTKYKISQDHKKCIGCGTCVGLCPTNWEMGNDGKAHPKKNTDTAACNLEAAKNCPVQCIKVMVLK